MQGNNSQLPKFEALDELVEFFDTHDMGDFVAEMPEVEATIKLQHRQRVFKLDVDLADKLTEIAKNKHTTTGELINTWLRERVLAEP